MRRQLHPLRFASRKRRSRLPEAQIAQPDFIKHAQFFREPRNLGKKLQPLANGQVQHFMNVLAFVVDIEHLRLVARAFAFVANQFHISQKLHFNGDRAIALAGFATPAGHVKRKMSGREAALLRFRQRGKKLADNVEGLDISDRIRARSAANGRLIDENNLIEKIVAFNARPTK